tara:strand:+ start:1291 stop:2130 length:840 start_codon:yes stop_codon:yes gene_type:complete
MIEEKKIYINTERTNSQKPYIIINESKREFKSERGRNFVESINFFYQKFDEYFDYYFKDKTEYYKETKEQIEEDFSMATQNFDIITKKDFKLIKNYFLDLEMCDYYENEYRQTLLELMSDMDFESKRFYTKHYKSLPIYNMQLFIEDFLLWSEVDKKLYSENYIKLIKYDEYIIYQNEFNELFKKKYRIKNFNTINEKKQKKAYIIKDKNTGHYKIGKSINPLDREKTLQSEKPTLKLIKVFKKDIEAKLHKEYKDFRIRGEWFKLNKVQLQYICTTYK